MASSKFEKCCAKIEHPFPNRNSDKALLPFSSAFTSFAAATFIIITLLFLTLSLITPWITLSNFIALRQFSLLIHVLQLPLALITGQWSGFFVHLTQCFHLATAWQCCFHLSLFNHNTSLFYETTDLLLPSFPRQAK